MMRIDFDDLKFGLVFVIYVYNMNEFPDLQRYEAPQEWLRPSCGLVPEK